MPEILPLAHQWKFFRAGGFDQVLLETGEDLLALPQLDKKLWSALSCPINGVEFDQRTLQMIDSDGDGYIRAPEMLAAVEWAGKCLSELRLLVNGQNGVPLSALNNETDEGRRVLNAARTLLANLGKPDADTITVEDALNNEATLATTRFNGDGVITAATTDDEELKGWITDIISCMGSVIDRSGEAGINRETVERFSAEAGAWMAWHDQQLAVVPDRFAREERTEIMQLWQTVKPKIDDYFLRCSMAAYDSRAAVMMSGTEESLAALALRNLTEAEDDIAALPLSAVSLQQTLPLDHGLNPAWSTRIASLRSAIVQPLRGDVASLSSAGWLTLKDLMREYEAWWDQKIDTTVAGLGVARLRQWVTGAPETAIMTLIEQDEALQPAFDAIAEVERLTRYCRDLLPLANNFVSFRDFYTGRGKAIFQSGTLFLDSRSFELCVTVADVAKHAILANLSRVYLVYCDCIRNGGADKITIAAAITNGDSDQLLVGRNGVFFDRKGLDWHATIVRIIEHPISIRQAFWDPYKRIAKMVGEALQKIAAAKSKANEEKAVVEVIQAGQKKDQVKPPPPAFDVGKFAGIFAAIGLAIGAIGTAIATILSGFFKLPWWQMPLVLVGIVFFVSGPSIFLAWLKLRQRNLGRLLDANGWAVNTRARINIPFGTSLTGLAGLPSGSSLALFDPFAEKKRPWKIWILIVVAIATLLIVWKMELLPF